MKAEYEDCIRCGDETLVTNWDDLEGILVSDIVADTTPLTRLEEVACILIGRPTYILEATIIGTRRLSLRTPRTMAMTLPHPIAVLPHHRCGARHPGILTALTKPEPDQLTQPPF
jgi:hypothetical protein